MSTVGGVSVYYDGGVIIVVTTPTVDVCMYGSVVVVFMAVD